MNKFSNRFSNRMSMVAFIGGTAMCAHASAQTATTGQAGAPGTAAEPPQVKVAKAKTLPAVNVSAARLGPGSLRVNKASLGPLGTRDRLDTPYSINVVPQSLIQRMQLKSIADALRFIPSVQGDGVRPQSRGVQGSVVQNSRIDGFNAVSTTDYPLEQFDRIEVMNGPAGGLYGPANPAGTFNYVQKRPTDQPLTQFTLGYSSRSRLLREVDLSQRLGADGAWAYRFTALNENGGNYTHDSHLRRQLLSLALDYHFSPDTVVQTNFSYYRYVSKGLPATFSLASGVHFPGALNPNKSAYASRYGGNDNTTTTGSIKLIHDFSENWHLTAGALRQIADRESTGPTNTLIDNAGDYKTTISTATASRFTITSNLLYLNGKVDTGPVTHGLTLGTSGFVWDNFNPRDGGTVTLGSASLARPEAFELTGVPDFKSRYQSAKATQQSLIAADDISFSSHWSALLVGSQSWLSTHNYSRAGVQTSSSDNHGVSSAASLIFKPQGNMSIYVTHADSLQQGDTAPAGSSNAGDILAPYRSKQWELGYKVALSKINLSLAAFRLTRPFAYTQSNGAYAVAGQQRNRGVELMLDGQASDDLALFGGITWLDPRIYNTSSAATDGRRIVGLPRLTANMLADYRIRAIPGLSTDFNVHFVGARSTDNAGLSSVSSYTTFDLSLLYTTMIQTHRSSFRLGIYNLADRRYWTNIVPGGLNGYTAAGNASAMLGAPRTMAFSIQLEI